MITHKIKAIVMINCNGFFWFLFFKGFTFSEEGYTEEKISNLKDRLAGRLEA